jgi:HSP20 family protein
MTIKKETGQPALTPARTVRDPFALLRTMTSEFDRFFEEPHWPFRFAWPRGRGELNVEAWVPEIDVFERDNTLVTKVDLPGLKKEEVKVEVVDGMLTIAGERANEAKEGKDNYYRCERTWGAFTRTVPLPDGVTIKDVKATFVNGVLEVTVPLPAKVEAKKHIVEIAEGPNVAKAA